ncbi:MAG: sigma-70 family RNA polymerase sigma factor [Planctomycetes bacterium]|nr:sigma-70 family RNA polymerase sigma factor [Planctomycetota bacterium]
MAQATLTAATSKMATYRGEAALFSWLCTFCRHEIHRHVSRVHRAGMVVLDEDAVEVRAALDSLAAIGSAHPDERRTDLARLVRVVLDALPPRYSEALEWKYLDGLPVAEIAQRLRLGTKAVESLLTRARAAFRDGFSAVCEGDVSSHLNEGTG